jgi:hypothetical protein
MAGRIGMMMYLIDLEKEKAANLSVPLSIAHT